MFSGDAPLPVTYEERKQVEEAALFLRVPSLKINSNNKKLEYYIVAFDGTKNDKDNVDENSRQTVVAHLYHLLEDVGYEGKYYKGPGTQRGLFDSWLDAAKCTSCVDKAQEALDDFAIQLNKKTQLNSNVEIRIITIGFSRGAAIARHFMNMISDKYQTSILEDKQHPGNTLVRTTGILYDTVATGVIDKLNLGISPSTDFLLHFIANDETRRLFPVVSDFDINFFPMRGYLSQQNFNTCKAPRISTSNRMVQLALPGAHSDIGASYKSGLGSYYRMYGEIALREMGLIDKVKFELEPNVFTSGKHDSRGFYDYFSEYLFGNKHRGNIITKSVLLDSEEFRSVKDRLEKLHQPANVYFRQNRDIQPVVFDVNKNGNTLNMLYGYAGIDKMAFQYDQKRKQPFITYTFPKSKEESRIELSEKVWSAIPEGQNSRLEFITLERKGIVRGYFYVNCQLIETIET